MAAKRASRASSNQQALTPMAAMAQLLKARDPDDLLRRLPGVVAQLTRADLVRVLSQSGSQLKVLATSEARGQGMQLEPSADAGSLALELGKPVLWQEGAGEPLSLAHASALAMPLTVEGEPPLALSCYREAPFSPEERDDLAAFLSGVPPFWERLTEDQAQLRQRDFMIAQVREQLETSEKLKAEFVATMSHELRTPLNVVLGFGSLLADEAFGPLNTEQDEACQKIMESTERLAMLINDLLDFSKLQARMLDFNVTPVVVPDLLETVIEDLRPLAERKELQVELVVPEDLPRLPFDADRLEQSLKHLLDNAIKFTAPGGAIGLRACFQKDVGTIEIEVWDTGIGIPPEAMSRLFERFYQVDSSSTRLFGGTGIGLALVKELIERQGGQVTVESKVGQGSTFRLLLPLKAEPEEEMVG